MNSKHARSDSPESINFTDLEWLIENRPEQEQLCHDHRFSVDGLKNNIFKAGVKTGKNLLIGCQVAIDRAYDKKNTRKVRHIYVSSLERTANKYQHDQFNRHGIKTFTSKRELKDDIFKYVDNLLDMGYTIIIHYDELDWGCAMQSMMRPIFDKYFQENPVNIAFKLYSATPEIALNVGEKFSNIELIEFTPNSDYCGIQKILEQRRFKAATDFIEYEGGVVKLTEQGEYLINEGFKKAHDKKICTLRLTGKMYAGEKEKSTKYSTFERYHEDMLAPFREKYRGRAHVEIHFEMNKPSIVYHERQDNLSMFTQDPDTGIPIPTWHLIVVNQTISRSTELGFLHHLNWAHTHRPAKSPLSTVTQDQERFSYYEKQYEKYKKWQTPKFVDFTVYGDVQCARYSAGYIDLKELHECNPDVEIHQYSKIMVKKNAIKADGVVRNPTDEDRASYRVADSRKFDVSYAKTDEIREKYRRYDGFYMTDLRSCIREWKEYGIKCPVLTRSRWDRDTSNGLPPCIGSTRTNVFYEDDETNPDNFKIVTRTCVGFHDKLKFKNTSCYTSISYPT